MFCHSPGSDALAINSRADILPDRSVQLLSEDQPRKSASLTLPLFSEGFKADVLCENDTAQLAAR